MANTNRGKATTARQRASILELVQALEGRNPTPCVFCCFKAGGGCAVCWEPNSMLNDEVKSVAFAGDSHRMHLFSRARRRPAESVLLDGRWSLLYQGGCASVRVYLCVSRALAHERARMGWCA